MKITRNTPDYLIVEDTPWQMAIFLLLLTLVFTATGLLGLSQGKLGGLAFFAGSGLGIYLMFVFVRRVQVVFDRQADTMTIQRRNLIRADTVTHDLSEVSKAVIETSYGEYEKLYRPTLIFDSGQSVGKHPIHSSYTTTTAPHDVVAVINAWLTSD